MEKCQARGRDFADFQCCWLQICVSNCGSTGIFSASHHLKVLLAKSPKGKLSSILVSSAEVCWIPPVNTDNTASTSVNGVSSNATISYDLSTSQSEKKRLITASILFFAVAYHLCHVSFSIFYHLTAASVSPAHSEDWLSLQSVFTTVCRDELHCLCAAHVARPPPRQTTGQCNECCLSTSNELL